MTLRRAGAVLFAVLALAACGGDDGYQPEPTLIGNWDITGYSEDGVESTTTGTAVFRNDGTFTFDGSIKFPDEPIDAFTLSGSFVPDRGTVLLTTDGIWSTTWTLYVTNEQAVLVAAAIESAPTLKLRRKT